MSQQLLKNVLKSPIIVIASFGIGGVVGCTSTSTVASSVVYPNVVARQELDASLTCTQTKYEISRLSREIKGLYSELEQQRENAIVSMELMGAPNGETSLAMYDIDVQISESKAMETKNNYIQRKQALQNYYDSGQCVA